MKRLALASFVLIACVLSAQEFRASLSGEVTDPSGASIAGAVITITNIDRNTDSTEVTNALGRYVVSFLAPGSYKVAVDKPGFRKSIREGTIRDSANCRRTLRMKNELWWP